MINLEKGLQDGWNLVNESAYVLKQSEKKRFSVGLFLWYLCIKKNLNVFEPKARNSEQSTICIQSMRVSNGPQRNIGKKKGLSEVR